MNWIMISKEKKGYYSQKNTLFDILSFANQLYKLKSTYWKNSKYGKI